MHISLYEIAVWLIVGLIGGTLAGLIVKGGKHGFGLPANLALGLAGAVIGGLLFRLLGLFPNLDKISISLRDIVSALAGSILVLGLLWLWRRRGG
ncbi:MAG: GlsB/YeaQ/YmgE family stress response membrane protein [Rhodomicrobium sp.]